MKDLKLFFSFFLFCPFIVKAQVNLVLNPSFEDTIYCPNAPTQITYCQNWNNVPHGSPDYLNSCNSGSVSVPLNTFGYEFARTGNAYAGLATFAKLPFLNNAREFIQGKLTNPLKAGKKYCTIFFVSVGDSGKYGANNIGAYFSDTMFNYTGNVNTFFSLNPQVVNPNANILNNKTGWKQVSGSFIAKGGEKYIIIGNFKDDANTNYFFISPGATSYPDSVAYYFIDDVSVYCCEEDSCKDAPSNIVLFPNPNNGIFTLQYFLSDKTNAEIEIYNLLGQVVYRDELEYYKYTKQFNLPNLADGVYWFKVKQKESEVFRQKVIVAR